MYLLHIELFGIYNTAVLWAVFNAPTMFYGFESFYLWSVCSFLRKAGYRNGKELGGWLVERY